MSSKHYYITTTIPYVNADPHIGFALEITQADCLARYHRLLGDKVFHNFGSDEHGIKIYRKALEEGKDPQNYVDEYAAKFKNLKQALNLEYDAFIRTTDESHIKAAQEFWNICAANGDIYKKSYKTKYCVGCEMEKTDSELVDGFCEFHPGKPLEIIEEENYFFKFSKYQDALIDLYTKNPEFVVPAHRLNEIKSFVESGLNDFSISRLKEKLPWGVPVPGDSDHVMYVWFDALVNYISVLGWPQDSDNYKNFWPGIQTAGKDNLRQQSAIWQAMLISANLPTTKQIFIHGFINSGGQRMSKTLGNVVNPYDLVEKYGTDAVRYFLLAKIHPWEDSDFTIEKFEDAFNADLANGLGNLVARVAKLCELNDVSIGENKIAAFDEFIDSSFENYRFDYALGSIWERIANYDKQIAKHELWKDTPKKLHILADVVEGIRQIAFDLKPFLPQTAEKIAQQFQGPKAKTAQPLFPRLG
jgi:methionyl-tRNA synthetase